MKQKTQDRTYIAPASQYLYFGGTLLEDGYTLSDYSIGRGSTLPLVATAAFTSTPLPNVVWNFGVNDMAAGAGIGWTLWQAAGAVDLSSYSSGAITFNVFGYNGLLAGMPGGYDPASPYSLTFLTASGGITGLSADMFSMTGDFASRASVNQVGNNLVLHVAPVPEPSTYAVALAGLTCGGYSMFRRRKRA